jgi:D-3-phosphoglycerate dehydrogenase
MKTLLLENIHANAHDAFRRAGAPIQTTDGSLDDDALIEALQGVSLLGIRSRTHITERVLAHAPDLLAIGAFCIGTNQIDLEAASLNGVAVFNAPYSNTRSVAELVIAEIIFLVRRVYPKVVRAHAGGWEKSADNAREVRGKKLGIIGFGNIGSQVSTLAEAMGMDVYYYDTVDKLSIGNATRLGSLDEVLQIADVVTVHVDGNPANVNIISERALGVMKPGACLLNLSRGHVVDIDALAAALRSGHLAGAAVDVFPAEPRDSKERFTTPLHGLPNVLLTPHIGGSTEEAQENIAEFVSGQLVEYVATGATAASVNFPRITAPRTEGHPAHRLLHIHQNVPGVLSQINGIFGKNNVNVITQYLRTNELIGYVLADVDARYKDALFEDLRNVAHTIRVRII